MDSLAYAFFPNVPEGKPWGTHLEKVNSYAFYEMARDLGRLYAVGDSATANEAFFPIINAHSRMLQVVNEGKPIPLGVCRPTAMAVLNAVKDLFDVYFVDDGQGGRKFEMPSETVAFPVWKLSLYRSALDSFETVFSAEMGEAATYFVPRKGIYFTPALVDMADESFPPELRGSIPDKTKADWRSAGRCLAFSLWSASGFHAARALEGILEVYYQVFTGKTGTQNGWYDYIKALEGVTGPPAPSAKILAGIKQMKDDYRNPLMHPRVVLDEAEARILFAGGESLIMGMASEIRDAKTTTPTLPGLGATLLTGATSS